MSTLRLAPRPRHDVEGGRDRPRHQGWISTTIGITVIFVVWAAAATRQPELILPSPAQTARALMGLAADGTLAVDLATTLTRSFTGVLFAFAIGATWGSLNGTSSWAASISRPALASLLALPPIMLVALGLTWLGPGGATTRLVIVLVAVPLLVFAVQEAVANIDRDLLEMAGAFELSRRQTLSHIIIPAVSSPVLAAVTVTLGQSVRVAVMAELLSAADGIGADVGRARSNLETADLFAWAIVLIAVVLVIELTVVRPVSNRLLGWRRPTV